MVVKNGDLPCMVKSVKITIKTNPSHDHKKNQASTWVFSPWFWLRFCSSRKTSTLTTTTSPKKTSPVRQAGLSTWKSKKVFGVHEPPKTNLKDGKEAYRGTFRPWNKSLNFIFAIEHVEPTSLKVSHWLRQEVMVIWMVQWESKGPTPPCQCLNPLRNSRPYNGIVMGSWLDS